MRKNDHIRLWGGWTFVETLVVIAIVMVLTGLVGFIAFRYIDQAKSVAAQSQIESYSMALNAYYIDNQRYPSVEQGLGALWEKPILDPMPENWMGPYIDKSPERDPWGSEYQYQIPGINNLPFTITSYGIDGLPGGEGNEKDINSWE